MLRSLGLLAALLLLFAWSPSRVEAAQTVGGFNIETCQTNGKVGCIVQVQTRTFKYEVPSARRRTVQPNYYRRQRQIYCNNCVQQCNNSWYQYWQFNYNGGSSYQQCRYNCNLNACRY